MLNFKMLMFVFILGQLIGGIYILCIHFFYHIKILVVLIHLIWMLILSLWYVKKTNCIGNFKPVITCWVNKKMKLFYFVTGVNCYFILFICSLLWLHRCSKLARCSPCASLMFVVACSPSLFNHFQILFFLDYSKFVHKPLLSYFITSLQAWLYYLCFGCMSFFSSFFFFITTWWQYFKFY